MFSHFVFPQQFFAAHCCKQLILIACNRSFQIWVLLLFRQRITQFKLLLSLRICLCDSRIKCHFVFPNNADMRSISAMSCDRDYLLISFDLVFINDSGSAGTSSALEMEIYTSEPSELLTNITIFLNISYLVFCLYVFLLILSASNCENTSHIQ